jgi:hypothetical protein
MSDQQVLAYLARAGQGVCGHFDAGQLERELPLVPPKASARIGWWHLLLAGALFSGKAVAQTRPAKAGIEAVVPNLHLAPVKDSFKILPPVEVRAFTNCVKHDLTGSLGYVTAGMLVTRKTEPTRWKKIVDTLSVLPKKELTVYPNPVRRGMPVSLSWQVEVGEYSVGIYNAGGALVQERIMSVGSVSQVDLLEIPAALPAGIYFLRAARAGNTKLYTRKLVVL